MRSAAPLPCAAFASVLAACAGPDPRQWVVSVATDAPVPQFGDQLLIEVLHGDLIEAIQEKTPCRGCVRIVEIEGPAAFPASFGVAPPEDGSQVHVRARLFRSAQAGPDGRPDPPELIDAVGRLPPLEGEDHVALDLSMRCFGATDAAGEDVAAGDEDEETDGGGDEPFRTCDPETGTFWKEEPVLRRLDRDEQRPRPGSWPPAAEVPCPDDVPRGMICVPGGVFLLGSPLHAYVPDIHERSLPEHLVKLAPFAMDTDEVSVGLVRKLRKEGRLTSEPDVRRLSPEDVRGACTFLGVDSPEDDNLPVNCISRQLAEEICRAQRKCLPTEAEWEYAAGNRDAETRYPWGDEGDAETKGGDEDGLCGMAVLGVGRDKSEIRAEGGESPTENTGCTNRRRPSPVGPVQGGENRDRTSLGIMNLAGSLREWVADMFAPYSAGCWYLEGSPPEDPRCTLSVPWPVAYAVRGSSWAGYKFAAKATARGEVFETTGDPYTGLRCVVRWHGNRVECR